MDKTLPRDARLDFAKAVAISLVLFWHLLPIRLEVTGKSSILIKILAFGSNQFYTQICLVAVPMFFLVSLYLFFRKIEGQTLGAMSKRCLRIGRVYLFWAVFQCAFFYVILCIQNFYSGANDFSFPIPIHRLLMQGGPPLPIVGPSVFYFLFVLLILVVMATVFYSFRDIPKLLPLTGVSVFIISVLYFEFLNLNGRGLDHWRIENFIIYIPLSYFLLRQGSGKLVRYIPYFYLGFILFSAQDIYFQNKWRDGGCYSRISIVCGSLALFSSILQLKKLRNSTVITLLATYSLGIFATHKYWQLIVTVAFQHSGFAVPVGPEGFSLVPSIVPLDLQALTIAVITIVFTFTAIFLGSHTRIRRYIT